LKTISGGIIHCLSKKENKDMYILKPEYVGTIMEIIREEMKIVFDTNIEPEDKYEYYYNIGFDWAFDKI